VSGRFFEDFSPGDVALTPAYEVRREEMIAFARQWDPLPIHIDEEAARVSPHGRLIASGEYTMAVKQKLLTSKGFSDAVIGSIGYDNFRYHKPVHAGDSLRLRSECVAAVPSRSKPDRGVVTFKMTMLNQHDEPVISYLDIIMMARRPATGKE